MPGAMFQVQKTEEEEAAAEKYVLDMVDRQMKKRKMKMLGKEIGQEEGYGLPCIFKV